MATDPFAGPLVANRLGFVLATPSLDATLLLQGYRRGCFPWTDNPVGWFCPAWRGLMSPSTLCLPRNFARLMRRSGFVIRCDTHFEAVMRACRFAHRADGEWITERFVRAYVDLFEQGFAHSVEVWRNDALIGGLYGVQLGGIFSAESMFASADNASKAALWAICSHAKLLGIEVIDVQVVSETTAKLGAVSFERDLFFLLLKKYRADVAQTPGASWQALGDIDVAAHFPRAQ